MIYFIIVLDIFIEKLIICCFFLFKKKKEIIYPSINIIFTFISINNKNNNKKWEKQQKEIKRNKQRQKETIKKLIMTLQSHGESFSLANKVVRK